MADHFRAWLIPGGNPNRKTGVKPKEKKANANDIELVRYELDDKYKNQSEEIDPKNQDLVDLFNTIADARCEVRAFRTCKKSKDYQKNFAMKKVAFCLKKVEEAGHVRAQILALGGRAPAIPSHFSNDI